MEPRGAGHVNFCDEVANRSRLEEGQTFSASRIARRLATIEHHIREHVAPRSFIEPEPPPTKTQVLEGYAEKHKSQLAAEVTAPASTGRPIRRSESLARCSRLSAVDMRYAWQLCIV